MLSRGNFYAEKQHSDKVLPFGARGPVIMRHRVFVPSMHGNMRMNDRPSDVRM